MPDPLKIIAKTIQQKLELESARQKQLRTLPREPRIPGWEFATLYRPVEELGGDFYDFVHVSDRELGIAIGDVSGHGVDAAFVMGKAMKALNIFGRGVSSPARALVTTNADIFPDLDRQTFVTVFYGVLDLPTGTFRYAGAGHPAPLLYRSATRTVEPLDPKGVLLGMDKGPLFERNVRELETVILPGDAVLAFTDGVLEAPNLEEQEFGGDRVRRLLEDNAAGSLSVLATALEKAVRDFQETVEQKDDLTLLVLRRTA